MTSLFSILCAAALIAPSCAQSQYVEPSVPTGTPIPGNYSGALRPQVHFSPPKDFMNDPNGMFVDANGTYHLYYQYNPTGVVAGNQHWGHATSKDLYHWINQQIAIFPPDAHSNIFSGSAVVDVNNTSGFFPHQDNGVVAVYTINTPTSQTQALSFSFDGGYTFELYSGNPVLSDNSSQFRDPKVIWHAPTQRWVMVVAYAQDLTVGFFTSSNLTHWEHVSNFSHHGLLGDQYECPNLVQIPMQGQQEPMYLLAVSINPGAPLGGSITQYFPGSFNGTVFTPVDGAARIGDFGKDNYAGQFFSGIPSDQDQISIAWTSNWQYSQVVPTGASEGWRSSMSLPRVNYLKNISRVGYDLVSAPYNLSPVINTTALVRKTMGNSSVSLDYSSVASGSLYFQINITNIPPTTASITGTTNFTFSSSQSGESLKAGYFLTPDSAFFIDRGNIRGFDNPFFTDKFSTSCPYNSSASSLTWSVEGVIDRSILEVFINGGESSATVTFFSEQELDTLQISAGDLNAGVEVSVLVYGLNSAWARFEDAQGTVVGNLTSQTKA
ncbi:uncharacterized protein Z520_02228 [Fonsecaea multimorphosa CBS 102226]|uniref:Glycosyl hydrolase family 32 N-terminal domain-containing protein n=1 Tax=Fonsecaea multimorphosa CBS 102226 TaxID=1442371 RepID=A0A0D2KF90_9EURO|nr:uncharacterized protein Z520_02228 [Fonsecaea multimorphosa CBS 102226]KIY02090.1 hypothetical protein Z520_02228 [Fonsecaea multimorphosa CBS 102226]OAL29289.1 hypothetical protein AYO22_02183 [Fonsecaea multimorphosa]